MRRVRQFTILFGLGAALHIAILAGCGGGDDGDKFASVPCSRESRKDVYAASMMKSGAAGYQVRLLESTPAPPQKNDNAWRFELLNPAGGTVTSAAVTVFPFMPDHGHGTPIQVQVTAPGAGETAYRASPINLWMPGLWRINVQVSEAGKSVDTVEFFFCIDG